MVFEVAPIYECVLAGVCLYVLFQERSPFTITLDVLNQGCEVSCMVVDVHLADYALNTPSLPTYLPSFFPPFLLPSGTV